MADKQRAYDTRKNTDLFADDDPLAELARIVGFEPRVAANTVEDAPRQEPAFNLEDELLREFDRYEEPQSAASFDRLPEPVFEQPAAHEAPIGEAEVAPAAEAEPDFVVEPEVAIEPVVSRQQEVASNLTPAAWASNAVRDGEPVSGGARDLIEELEMSIGTAPVPPTAPAKAPQWSAASIRLPIANFHPARRDELSVPAVVPVAAPVVQRDISVPESTTAASEHVAVFEAPVAAGFPAEIDRHEEPEVLHEELEVFQDSPVVDPLIDHSAFDLAAAAKDGDVQADAALTEALPTEIDDINFDIDDLLADVSHYPVPERQTAPAADVAELSRVAEPVRVVAPIAAPMPKPVEQPVQVPSAKAEPEGDDPFAGHDFELDLEGIELELADFDFAEPAKPQPQPQAIEPARVQTPELATVQTPHVEAARPVAPMPVFQAAQPAAAVAGPIRQAPVEMAPATNTTATPAFSADAGDDLPFDPSMISDAEYHPEAVEEMHVPVLPPVEQPELVVTTSDFDFDVDAEIANLLAPAKPAETPAKPVVEEWRTRAPISVAPTAAPAAPIAKQAPLQNLDEFERALEEDFRRSVNEPVQRRENVSQVQIQSASEAEDMSRARSMKRMLAAAAAIVVFGGVAYAGYTFLAGNGRLGIASGEPRVITADKDPVKVVPENPGGKTVPNQDKAVYDSVGGAAAEEPKQKALVSSNEQPVDVVQRTLTPETLPEDNDSDVATPPMATPVGDTQDPRLLPSQDTAVADEADSANQAPSVSARKVRTMIVRPDGTLVARDEPAPQAAPTLPKATPVQTQKITAGAKPAGGTAANFPASAQVASADIRSTPVEETKPTPAQAPPESALAKAAAATPANVEPPVRAVKSAPVDAAPAPAARPVETEQTKAAAAEAPAAPAAPKPKEVAAVSPAATQVQPTAAAGGYGVQIASLPSEEEAKKSYASLSKKFAGVLSGRSYEIRKAEIAGKGTFYRVRIPAGSKDEAAAICEKYRAAGGSCLISK